MPRRAAKAKTGLVYTASERGKKVFSCPIRCEQCVATTADGRRCARRSCIGTPFCWTHTQRLAGVQIRSYPGMGKGLMAVDKERVGRKAESGRPRAVVFKKGEFIMPYLGEVLTKAEHNARYVTPVEDSLAEYVLIDGAGRYVDAACSRTVSGLANTAMTKASRVAADIPPLDGKPIRYISSVKGGTNTKFTIRTKAHSWHGVEVPAKSAWVVATKPIREGDQILTYYGDDYRVYVTPGYQTTGTKRQRLDV